MARRIRLVLAIGMVLAAAGAAIAAWSAPGPSPRSAPRVTGFDAAPAVTDAATRFASLEQHHGSPMTVRSVGRHAGLDWFYARGASANVCLISAEPDGMNLGMVCTPPEDSKPADLRVSRDTSSGRDVSAVVVPDSDTTVSVDRGPGSVSAIDHNLVVVDQSDDVVLSASDAAGNRTEIDLPDRVKHHGEGARPSSASR